MANNIAFQASGMTYKANATTTSQTIQITSVSPTNQYLLSSHQPTGTGGFPVYVNISTAANVTVSAPTNGSPSNCFVIVPGMNRAVTAVQCSPTQPVYVAYITDTGASSAVEAYITPGEGI
jgi:hypothetical protein